jgi:hypothetical protein
MKLGILQGRLSIPVQGHIQEFPYLTWKQEFDNLDDLGLIGIEWLITPNTNHSNPLFTEVKLPKNILSVCVDTMVNSQFYDKEFMEVNLIPVLNKMTNSNLTKVVIPLLESSSIENSKTRYNFLKNITDISEQYPTIDFCFEFECKKEIIKEIVDLKDNFFITYDTGNFTSTYKEKVNHGELISYFNRKIKNIHFKDRTYDGKTKNFGDGNTNFIEIIDSLKKINYNENIILQLARGEDGDEINYIKEIVSKITKIL